MPAGRAWRVQTAGCLAGMSACGMIHILLVIAVLVILVRVISGRRIEPACV
ncbi:MAG: lmo0937 family membrane protein [Polaromonas sp.]|nr:lmo0937 family membrane protein [Polaromonas sp.]